MENQIMKKQIVVSTTGVLIIPYRKGQSKQLEYETSTYDKIFHRPVPTTGFYNEEGGVFATYKMSLYHLKELFPDYEVTYYKNDHGKYVSDTYSMTVELNEYQREVGISLMGLKEHEAYVNMPTASGKTVLAVSYIAMQKKKTLIFCYSTKILEQWRDTFETKTTMRHDKLMTLEASVQMNHIISGKLDVSKIDVFLCTTSLIDSFGRRYGYDKLQPLLHEMGIGLKIIDEAHTRLGSTIRLNAYTSIDKTVYLSADYNQSDETKFTLFQQVFKFVPLLQLSPELLSSLRHITASVWSFNSRPNVNDTLRVTGNAYKWSNIDYCRYEFEKETIMTTLMKLLDFIGNNYTETAPDGSPYKILILTQLIEHVDLIYDSLDGNVSKFYSAMEPDEKKDALKADIIVSTYKSFSTGIDVTTPQIRHVISTCPVDVVTSNQSAGRCRPITNLQSYFWMISDYGFTHCANNIEKVLRYLLKNKIGEVKRFHCEDGEVRIVSGKEGNNERLPFVASSPVHE